MATYTAPGAGFSAAGGIGVQNLVNPGINDAAPAPFRIPAPVQHVTRPVGGLMAEPIRPTTFGHLMQSMIRDVNSSQTVAADKVRDVLAGGKTTVHEAMVASEEARVSFRVLQEVRNKLLESYQEVMRMQV
jgi:flagellar hook-basal body complex protein FliE